MLPSCSKVTSLSAYSRGEVLQVREHADSWLPTEVCAIEAQNFISKQVLKFSWYIEICCLFYIKESFWNVPWFIFLDLCSAIKLDIFLFLLKNSSEHSCPPVAHWVWPMGGTSRRLEGRKVWVDLCTFEFLIRFLVTYRLAAVVSPCGRPPFLLVDPSPSYRSWEFWWHLLHLSLPSPGWHQLPTVVSSGRLCFSRLSPRLNGESS